MTRSASVVAGMILAITMAMAGCADSKTHRVRTRYVPPEDPGLQEVYEDLRERGTLEKLQEFLRPFRLPRTLTIQLSECDGEADAFYGDDEITICYEYAALLWKHAPAETTPAGVEPIDVRDAFMRATAPKPVIRVATDHITPIRLTVGDAVNELSLDLPERGRVSFRALTSQLVDRIEVVVYFLAVLELYKQDLVDIAQFTSVGEIELEWTGDTDHGVALDEIDVYDG